MYYQELIQKFWDFNEKSKLGSTAIAMYLHLLKLGNDAENYTISVSDVVISKVLGITKKTVKPTKEKLRKFGLIQYENKPGFPCSYRLLLNYPLEISETEKVQNQSENSLTTEKELQILITKNVKTPDFPTKNNTEIPKQNDEIPQKNSEESSLKSIENPSLEEFVHYAKTLDNYENSLDSKIKEKYDFWTKNDWKNNSGRPITNWKSSLKSALPYLKNTEIGETPTLESIPNIKRPVSK